MGISFLLSTLGYYEQLITQYSEVRVKSYQYILILSDLGSKTITERKDERWIKLGKLECYVRDLNDPFTD